MHLERLLLALKPQSPPTQPGLPAPIPDSARGSSELETAIDGRSECGSMRISATELTYVSSDHWAAIVDRIADMRDYVDREEHLRLVGSPDDVGSDAGDVRDAATARPPRALLLYGCPPGSRAEILAAMPPKTAVDRYISRYFNRLDLVSFCKCLVPCSRHSFAFNN